MAPSILVVAEVADGTLTRLSTEVATLARTLAERPAARPSGWSWTRARKRRRPSSPTYLPRVVVGRSIRGRGRGHGHRTRPPRRRG